jgi:hypothetical protein
MFEAFIPAYLVELRKRLDQAAELARAAEACAATGGPDAALDVAFDIEQHLYEATTLLNAASLLNRIRKQQ